MALKRLFFVFLALQIAACSGGDDAGSPDAALAIDAADVPTIDADTAPDATISLAAPIVTAPVADEVISSGVLVVGTGAADASIAIVVLSGATEIGSASGTADGSGAFSIPVTYEEPVGGTALSIEVVQSDEFGSSPATAVAVAQNLVALTISEPLAAAVVFDPVRVAGSAEPGATIDVSILDGATVIGSGSTTASEAGAFNFVVSFTNAAAATALTVRTTQTSGVVISSPVDVAVVQDSVQILSGTVSQVSGNNGGTAVYVRLYDEADEVLDFVDQQMITGTDGIDLPSTAYSFQVGNGSYFVRAFRDSDGPGGAPDSHPTLTQDAQSPPLAVVISDASSTGNAVVLEDTNGGDRFDGFNAFSINESFEARPPFFNNGNGFVAGTGLCGGFYMRVEASQNGVNLSPPLVRLPDGTDASMLDDGACGENVHDNSSLSYDRNENDSQFSFGIATPAAAQAGDYVFHYVQTTGGQFIHSQVDTIADVIKLDRGPALTSPSGAAANADVTPTLVWSPVAGADGYFVQLRGTAGYEESDLSDASNFTVDAGNPLIDDRPYEAHVFPVARDAVVTNDIDAAAGGATSYFVTDVDGDSSVTISGDIENLTAETGDYLAFGRGSGAFGELRFEASVVLAAAATSYSLVVLQDQNPNCPTPPEQEFSAEVLVAIDINGSGELNNSQRDAIAEVRDMNGCADQTGQDVRFVPSVELVTPLEAANGVGDTPTFTWLDYADTFALASGVPITDYAAAHSYALFAQYEGSLGGDFPDIIWGLPSGATTLDMSSLPAMRFDIVELASGGGASNLVDLTDGTNWRWGIVVVECDFAQLDTLLSTDPYRDCLGVVLSEDDGFFAMSEERSFTR